MSKKKLHLSKTCRGNQKIFSRIETPKGCAHVTAAAVTSTQKVVPAITYPFRKGDWVLVLAVTDCDQTVTVTATDEEGEVIATLTKTIDPEKAKRSSQFHTLAHDPTVKRIRNMDTDPHPDHFDFEIKRMVREEGPVPLDIISGNAVIVTADEGALTCPVEVLAIDHTGQAISTKETILSEATKDAGDGLCRRTVSFSIRVPFFAPDYLLWIKTPGGAYDRIYYIDPEERTERHNWWRAWSMPVEDDSRYPEFFDQVWAASAEELDAFKGEGLLAPRVSAILVTDGSDLKATDQTVESLIAQTYANLDIIVSCEGHLTQAIKDAAARWQRRSQAVRALTDCDGRTHNEALAAAIDCAQGSFIAVVEDFDLIAPDAISRLARIVRDDEEVDVCYADEDILKDKVHTRPYFKPEWEPDLLLGCNYVAHPLFVRTDLVGASDILEHCPEGDAEHYVALMATHAARKVTHIPRVLYHNRREKKSPEAAAEASVKAVSAALARWGVSATAYPNPRLEGCVEVDYEMRDHPLVSVLIPNKDQAEVLRRCMTSLLKKTTYDNFEVIIIENNSEDKETFDYYDELTQADDRVRVVTYEGPFNFASINNFGASAAIGSYLLLLNNDTEVIEGDWMRRMVSVCARPDTGIVGAKLMYPDDSIQHAGVVMRAPGVSHQMQHMPRNYAYWTVQLMQDVTCVTAACLITKRSVFDEMGGLDEAFAVDYNDVDYCWKVYAKGYKVVYDPAVELYHLESVSRGKHETQESKDRFQHEIDMLTERYPDHYGHIDPASNPNLDQHTAYQKLNPLLLPQ